MVLFANRTMWVSYGLASLSILFLILSISSYINSTGALNHAGEKVGAGCLSCPLVLPLLMNTAIYGTISAITGGIATWLAIRNERKHTFSIPESELDLYPGIQSDVEANADEESFNTKAKRPPT